MLPHHSLLSESPTQGCLLLLKSEASKSQPQLHAPILVSKLNKYICLLWVHKWKGRLEPNNLHNIISHPTNLQSSLQIPPSSFPEILCHSQKIFCNVTLKKVSLNHFKDANKSLLRGRELGGQQRRKSLELYHIANMYNIRRGRKLSVL